MEPDPLINPPAMGVQPAQKKTKNFTSKGGVRIDDNITDTNNEKTRIIAAHPGLNLVLCFLCVVCVTAIVYNSWREIVFHNRLNGLEARLAYLERKSSEKVDLLVDRYRRDIETRLKQRVTREVAVHQTTFFDNLKRTTRDAGECICPPGKILWLHF
ncbi:hypothetical protein Trydic_g1322 [Trypoxylus dichotomus]